MMNKTENKKSICFVLPGYSRGVIGGYKIVYEYANRLSEKGYDISIYYPQFSKNYHYSFYRTLLKIYEFPYYVFTKIFSKRWFILKNVKEILRFSYKKSVFSEFDVIVATSLDTAFNVHSFHLDKSKLCVYLIQDFEKWFPYSEAEVFESYRFPMKKICITPWLLEKVKSVGENATLIYNGLDFSCFSMTIPIEERSSYEISLMYHIRPEKRFEDSVKALEIVHQKIPEIHVSLFGVFEKPKNIPEYFTYHKNPSKEELNEIYNNSAIYVAASSSEGFGLTVAEAMMCGCVVSCTDNGGFSSMVKDGESGLLSPVFDYESLAKNIIRLISDRKLRIRLAKNGNENIEKFSWENAVEKFVEVVENI